jgi:hypothetical protein
MIARKTSHILFVYSEVPYDTSIDLWLHIRNIDFNQLVKRSRQYEQAYLAWETVRRTRNPFFVEGTGFEGYFIGLCQSPEEMLDRLLALGHNMLDSNCRLYRHDFHLKSKLMKTLLGECSETKLLDLWSDAFGAAVARLRCNVYASREAEFFQLETYRAAVRLPPIEYAEHEPRIDQEYAITNVTYRAGKKLNLDPALLKPCDYDAGLVVWTIGRFGHPLIREYLRELHAPPRWGTAA